MEHTLIGPLSADLDWHPSYEVERAQEYGERTASHAPFIRKDGLAEFTMPGGVGGAPRTDMNLILTGAHFSDETSSIDFCAIPFARLLRDEIEEGSGSEQARVLPVVMSRCGEL